MHLPGRSLPLRQVTVPPQDTVLVSLERFLKAAQRLPQLAVQHLTYAAVDCPATFDHTTQAEGAVVVRGLPIHETEDVVSLRP